MVIIRFTDAAIKRRVLGNLAGRFSFRSWANGDIMVPADALAYLAMEGFSFTVVGRATYEQLVPPRVFPDAYRLGLLPRRLLALPVIP
jgi:hypothetical protein